MLAQGEVQEKPNDMILDASLTINIWYSFGKKERSLL